MANISEKKKYHFIYKTINQVNNKFYIGVHSTNNLEDEYLGSGLRLWRAIRKYGKSNFKKEILEYHPSREELMQREKELVNEELLKDLLCMNLKPGGSGGLKSEEHKQKWNKAGRDAHAKYMIENPKYREKIRLIRSKARKLEYELGKRKRKPVKDWTGCKHKEETKRKIKYAKKGKGLKETNSQFGSYWTTNGIENKKIKKDQPIPLGFYKGRI